MIPGFNRSITFPINHRAKRREAYHMRSVSLPGESHPLIANLKEQIRAIQSWASGADSSLAWIEAGLSHIEHLLLAANEFLSLSETKEVLQHYPSSTDCLLESFLYIVDSYGLLLSDIFMLKQHHFEVQSALRRHDSVLLASSVKSQRRTEKELSHLAATLHATAKSSQSGLPSGDSEVGIIGVLREVICATSASSVVLIHRVVAVSSAASSVAASLALCTVRPFKKRISDGDRERLILVKFEGLEKCLEMVEKESERVLRSLVNSRVLLLNIQSGL
jgi:Arabidopsis protein of unknown function